MDHASNKEREIRVRMEVALELLNLSSARLKDIVFSGTEEAIAAANSSLRIARFRFLEARAEYLDLPQLTA